jgi:putative cardiolipin synthase
MAPQDSSAFAPVAKHLATRFGDGTSGFMLLDDNRSALEWRLRLIDAARHSIDLQYYLWYGDNAGQLVAHRILAAANRGVKIRLMIDDLNTLLKDAAHVSRRDATVAWLDANPNVELRLFNPWGQRGLGGRMGESLAEARRVNQRMHNKALIVDNTAVIIGGRNIGDEYLGLNSGFNFRDLDVLAVGPVAKGASAVFDDFWNSEWLLPASALGFDVPAEKDQAIQTRLESRLRKAEALSSFAIDPQDWSKEVEALRDELVPGLAKVVSDRPVGDGLEHRMLDEIRGMIRSSRHKVRVVNAYIIPTAGTISMLEGLHDEGVAIDVLTNSLASHDVPAVNSHYKTWRKPLLEAGVHLYELRHDGATRTTLADTPPTSSAFMGLHSKAMSVDGRYSYIGSMNYDPRSAAINTEMGVFVDSPELARSLDALIDRDIQADNSWRVSLDDRNRLVWKNSAEEVHRQPARNWWQRVEDVFFMMFPRELY